jgi:hypothetical protein
MLLSAFWDIVSCNPVKVNWYFGGTYGLDLQGSKSKPSKKPAWRRQQAELWFSTLNMDVICPPKRLLTFAELHGVISQKTEHFITTAVRTSNTADAFAARFMVMTHQYKSGQLAKREPIAVAARSKAWTVFARSNASRSQWPRGVRHELSSLARTLGSLVRIPLETWMSVCVYSVFVLSCVQVAALRWADPPSKVSYRLCKKSRNWKAAKVQQKGL